MFAFSIGARQGPRIFKVNPSVGFLQHRWAIQRLSPVGPTIQDLPGNQ
jgi:hypothetical protein